ncbi:MAG: class I SAM-dependent methyltransferase [Candidatus Hodarchaeota archaeon]
MSVCKICKNEHNNKSHIAREMMFGSRDQFEYIECAHCGCLQIKEIPNNLSKYYPTNYYSFQKSYYLKDNLLKSFFRHQRARYGIYGKNIIGLLLSKFYGMPNYYGWLKKVTIRFDSEILEVGCGVGYLLLDLQKDGFSNLTGIDPFIDDHIFYDNGVKILNKEIYEMEQAFDFIMLLHSLEHMPQPLSILKEIYRLLKPNQYALIRIPVASSFAWRKYGVKWVQLDAPRHLFLHTIKSIQILADEVGFQIVDIVFDSTEFQFWGSEQYLLDIALMDNHSYLKDPQKSIFSQKQIEFFKTKAIELNKNNDGDSVSIYLYKN